ncbi:ApeA N-terminal domain 1-containing protein [Arthrobacter sp. TMN-37]
MQNRGFNQGDSLPGLLIDGIEESPWVTGVLTFEAVQGITLSIPFLRGSDQFSTVSGWVSTNTCPPNLVLLTGSGRFSLHGCRVGSSSVNFGGSGFSTLQIVPHEVVYKDRDGDFEDELLVTELRSHIDGLAEWTNFAATSYSVTRGDDDRVKQLNVEVKAGDLIEWRHGDAHYQLSTDWRTDESEPGFRVREWVCLTTKFPTPRSSSEHLEHQRKVSNLLALMFGVRASFRRHEIRDPRFNQKVLSGDIVDVPLIVLVNENTASDHSRPNQKFKDPLATVTGLGTKGLNAFSRPTKSGTASYTLPLGL